MENHVVEAIVAVDDGETGLLRLGLRQPFSDLLELRDGLGLGRAVLLGPAVDLAREIIARLAEVAKTDRDGIEHVELGQRLDLACEYLTAVFRRLARQRR